MSRYDRQSESASLVGGPIRSRSAVQPKVATDLPVYTPGELERLAEESSFVCQAVLGVRVAYEKDSRRRAN
ncbi:MAG: hypothetical protein KBB15_08955 [Firmicutes bacterium]|nr:hypothetical protein [Bacillota bacterium]